jgi:hypothetical protein
MARNAMSFEMYWIFRRIQIPGYWKGQKRMIASKMYASYHGGTSTAKK